MPIDIDQIIPLLAKEVADYKTPIVDLIAVQTQDPYKVLVATILSARTRDEVTARAAARLFVKAPDLNGLALLTEKEIAKLIYPVGFYKTKAGYLAKLPRVLADEFGGRIPDEVEALVSLPGVGRKTANLVVGVAFHKPAICVDTHVHRIMNIWGYVETKNPLETEMALRAKLPRQYWQKINSILVAFGQGTCKPIAPHCDRCVIEKYCPKIGVTPRKLTRGSRGMREQDVKKYISWNINGLRAIEKKGLAGIISDLNPDILALQEIKAYPDQLPASIKQINGYHAYWHPAMRKGYAGICVYTKIEPVDVRYGLGVAEYDQEGRALTLEFADHYLINVYFPNAQHGLPRLDYKLRFNRELQSFADQLAAKKSVVICGDYNVAHREIDLANPKANENNPGFSAPERAWMDEFLNAGYIDTFRMFNQEPGQYSWWSYRFNARAKNIGWRIDYFCVDKKSRARVKAAGILKDVMGSDHCPVSLDFT